MSSISVVFTAVGETQLAGITVIGVSETAVAITVSVRNSPI